MTIFFAELKEEFEKCKELGIGGVSFELMGYLQAFDIFFNFFYSHDFGWLIKEFEVGMASFEREFEGLDEKIL